MSPVRLIAVLAAVGLGVFLYFQFGSHGEAPTKKKGRLAPAPVTTAIAETMTVPILISAIGNVQARSTVSVKSRVAGQIVEVAVREGQRVKKGDLLFRIDPRTFEAQLRQAESSLARDQANLTKAESDLARYRSLSTKGFSSQQRYEEASAQKQALLASIRGQEAAVEISRLNLEFTQIHAPIDGRAGDVLIHAGNLVEANADKPMLMIAETQPIFITFSVPERHLPRIKQRMKEAPLPVSVTIPDEGGAPISGEVFFINNTVDMTTGTIQLKARSDNEADRLVPGQFVEVSIRLEEIQQAVVVPLQAVQTSQKGQYLYVVKADKTVEMRPIETGPNYKRATVIKSGLSGGEVVVTEGQLRLYPGRKVAPKVAGEKSDAPRKGERKKKGKRKKEPADS